MRKINRREFVKASVITTVGAALPLHQIFAATPPLQFTQIKLSYDYAALEPSIDAATMDIHYNKHHTAYIKNANDAIAAENIAYNTEAEFFANVSKLSAKARNNGGGVWNHNFFWQVMKPGSVAPTGKVADAINGSFGSFEKFKEEFAKAAMGRFGSGWAWLVNDGGKLKIGSTPNQDNPLMDLPPDASGRQAGVSNLKGTPLLALDVWEHAYYLKYQNKRADYVTAWWNVVNWEEVSKRLV